MNGRSSEGEETWVRMSRSATVEISYLGRLVLKEIGIVALFDELGYE